MIIVETGMRTRLGQVARLLQDDLPRNEKGQEKSAERKIKRRLFGRSKRTPLQKAVQRMGLLIGVLAVIIAAAVFVIGLAWSMLCCSATA